MAPEQPKYAGSTAKNKSGKLFTISQVDAEFLKEMINAELKVGPLSAEDEEGNYCELPLSEIDVGSIKSL